MGFKDYFNSFCKQHGNTGKILEHNKVYSITLSKGKDNATAFMEEDELRSLSKKHMQDSLDELQRHFKAK